MDSNLKPLAAFHWKKAQSDFAKVRQPFRTFLTAALEKFWPTD
jgi:hypothetical protein